MGLNVLIVGAGLAGPALASSLLRSRQGHRITIIERAQSLRVAGAQIDLKHQGVPIVRLMGLMDKVKASVVSETGLEMVDSQDRRLISLGVSPADRRGLTLTSEYEIMRGDLVRILYDDSIYQSSRITAEDGELVYKFNTSVEELVQDGGKVQAKLSDGSRHHFDLVVGADGQRSRTRRLAFGSLVSEAAFKPLGIHAAYFTIPRIDGEGGLARVCTEPERLMLTRTSNRPVTGANIFTTGSQERIRESYSLPLAAQKQTWLDLMEGATWQADRFRKGLRDCSDFYAHEQGQVKMPNLINGSVVLLGDAGYCPSPFTGLGTTLALGGAYTLAGEICRHGSDLSSALHAYQTKIRPLVDECQQLSPGGPRLVFPSTALGVWIFQSIVRVLGILRIHKLVDSWMMASSRESAGWVAEIYPELNFETAPYKSYA